MRVDLAPPPCAGTSRHSRSGRPYLCCRSRQLRKTFHLSVHLGECSSHMVQAFISKPPLIPSPSDYNSRSSFAPSPPCLRLLGGSESSEQLTPFCLGLCPAGWLCDEPGTWIPKLCTPGHYCQAGNSNAQPCPAGSWSSATNLKSADECSGVQPGFYAPTGSVLPIPCPSWGLCAGRAYDKVNDAPGSQPVGVQGGKQVEQQTRTVQEAQQVVEQTIELLAADSGAVNETAFRLHMASVYDVPINAVSLTLTAQEADEIVRRQLIAQTSPTEGDATGGLLVSTQHTRALTTSSVRLTYSLRIDPTLLSSNPSFANTASDIIALAASLQTTAAGIATSLTTVLGVNVSQAAPPATFTVMVNRTIKMFVEVDCSRGSWGADGKCIACSPGRFDPGGLITTCTDCLGGTYQPERGASSCRVCGAGSHCSAGSSVAMGCVAGRFSNKTGLMAVEQCTRCPPGSACATTGSISPLVCAPGSYTSEGGRSSCQACTPGHFQSARGSVGCATCPSRTYASISGAAECNNCLSRLSSYPGSIECDICDEGFFRDAETKATPEACKPCFEKGARCLLDATLETVVVLPGFWRLSNLSRVMTNCEGSAVEQRCIGGTTAGVDGEGYCGERYTGPECLLCRGGRGLYLKEGECVDCPEVGGKIATLVGLIVAVIVTALTLHLAFLDRLGQRMSTLQPARRVISWLKSYTMSLGLPGKIKIIFSFIGIITSLDTTYDAMMPQSYNAIVDAAFGWTKTDRWYSMLTLPSECTLFASAVGSTYKSWLLVKGLTPLLNVLLATLGCIGIKCARFGCSRRSFVAGTYTAMPLALITSFVLVPSVSTNVFKSFLCTEYQFDGSDDQSITSQAYLSSDLHVRCSEGGHSDAEHDEIKSIAIVLICIWPVGMVALYAFVLNSARASLRARYYTPLVRGTGFLHKDYRPECFYWEIIELIRRTFLVGWVLLIFSTEHTFLRLVVALLFSVVSLVLLLSIKPYRRSEDNLLAAGCQLVLVLSFIGAMLIRLYEDFKMRYGTAVVQYVMVFRSTSAIATPLLVLTFTMAILMLLLTADILRKEGRLASIRLEATGAPPELRISRCQLWHLFLSHIWSTGQVSCAVLWS